jgi:hypothetical protein
MKGQGMLNILFAADFEIAKTGIASTASAILAQDTLGEVKLFSDRLMHINGEPVHRTSELAGLPVDVVFTHIEYSALPVLQKRYPEAIFHVGDWPLRYWDSVCAVRPFKGILGGFRCRWRLRRIANGTRLVFVTKEDRDSAVAHGFSRAIHLPIGVAPPKSEIACNVDLQSICFSGNFRFQPNREAALRLLRMARRYLPDFNIILVGYYADDFEEHLSHGIEIYSDVPSVVDFLALRRPVYVSLLETGAGAKNKILEAIVAGCPILCSPESLDSSIPATQSIRVVRTDSDVVQEIKDWNSAGVSELLAKDSRKLAYETRATRSWEIVATLMRELITPHGKGL